MTTLIGFRYLRLDEDFSLCSQFDRYDVSNPGSPAYLSSASIAYNIEATNQLLGFQIGCNGAYYLGCAGRFALQCGTNAGIYGNHIEVNQWMDAPSAVTVNPTGETFYSDSDTDQVAFLGELRLGASYQCTCNCRVYAGYRALGVTGVALTANQIPNSFTSISQIGCIDCNGSHVPARLAEWCGVCVLSARGIFPKCWMDARTTGWMIVSCDNPVGASASAGFF